MDDADRLFRWRNDPDTCASSRSTASIRREVHDRWMDLKVHQGYPQHIILIAESDGEGVGVVSFTALKRDLMVYEASINVAPEHRGKGFAGSMLKRACGLMDEFTLMAEIRRENFASRSVFRHCGFELVGSTEKFLRLRKPPI